MTTQELEQELITIKSTLQQLQVAVERISVMLHSTLQLAPPTTPITWLSLMGVGKEIWQDMDVDHYISQERDSWN